MGAFSEKALLPVVGSYATDLTSPTPTPVFLVTAPPPPTSTPTVCAPSSNDVDCDGTPNASDEDADGDGMTNDIDEDDDNDGTEDQNDSTPGGPGTSPDTWGPPGCPGCWCNACPTNTPIPIPIATQTPTPTPTCYGGNSETVFLSVLRNASTAFNQSSYDTKLFTGHLLILPDDDGPSDSDGVGGDDVRLCFRIGRLLDVDVLTGHPELAVIDSETEADALYNANYGVNVVTTITWPRNSLGIARQGADGMIVISGAPALTYYHEYGHTKGLPHTSGSTWHYNLMHEDKSYNIWPQTTASQAASILN